MNGLLKKFGMKLTFSSQRLMFRSLAKIVPRLLCSSPLSVWDVVIPQE
jgi:hypothetical protein